jgi:hypothetical protein
VTLVDWIGVCRRLEARKQFTGDDHVTLACCLAQSRLPRSRANCCARATTGEYKRPSPLNFFQLFLSFLSSILCLFWLRSSVVSVLTIVTDRRGLRTPSSVMPVFGPRFWLPGLVHSLEHCVLRIALSRSDANHLFIIPFALCGSLGKRPDSVEYCWNAAEDSSK